MVTRALDDEQQAWLEETELVLRGELKYERVAVGLGEPLPRMVVASKAGRYHRDLAVCALLLRGSPVYSGSWPLGFDHLANDY